METAKCPVPRLAMLSSNRPRCYSQPPRTNRMQMCVNQNNNVMEISEQGCYRPKRDFHFQVVPVQSCPKFFVWASKCASQSVTSAKAPDANKNKAEEVASSSSSSSAYSSQPTTYANSASPPSSDGPATPTVPTNHTNLNMHQQQQEPKAHNVRGRFAIHQATVSAAVPIHNGNSSDPSSMCCSAPSAETFKILSVSKKDINEEDDDGVYSMPEQPLAHTKRQSSLPPVELRHSL